MKRGLAMTYGLIRQSHHQKKVYCEVKQCKQTMVYLRILRENSLIYGYSVVPKTNRVLVYLRYYRNRPSIKTIRLFSKPGFRRYITKNNIFNTVTMKTNPGGVLMVSTTRTSKIEQLCVSKFDKQLQQTSKNYGELISGVW